MKRLIVLLCAVVLASCAQLGIQAPDTFNKRLAAGYETVAAVADTAYTLRAAGAITADEKNNVAASNDTALAGLDAAKGLASTDLKSADTRLTASIAILTALQAYLAAKGQK